MAWVLLTLEAPPVADFSSSTSQSRNSCAGVAFGSDAFAEKEIARAEEVAARLGRRSRRGWIPLLLGSVAIIGLMMGAWELVLPAFGFDSLSPALRWLLFGRATSTGILLALFAGVYVNRWRKQLEGAREELHAQRAALREVAWRHEQLSGLGATARVLAHEIRGPLHRIALQVAAMQKAPDADLAERARRASSLVRSEVDAVERLISEYVEHSAGADRPFTPGRLDACAMLEAAVDREAPSAEARGVRLELVSACDCSPSLSGDEDMLREALQALLRQAVSASPHGGRVGVECRSSGGSFTITVSDEGPPFQDPSAVFRPFYAAPRAGSSGLALALVRDVVRAHRGEISAENCAPGARILLRLPVEAA